jgi:hypothetical protein
VSSIDKESFIEFKLNFSIQRANSGMLSSRALILFLKVSFLIREFSDVNLEMI